MRIDIYVITQNQNHQPQIIYDTKTLSKVFCKSAISNDLHKNYLLVIESVISN